jgi:hypothetical protein
LKGASNLVVEYFNNRSSNVTNAFPTTLTTAIEGAFPGRVTRDATTGLITSIDRRAITLAETRDEHVRWGFNIGGNLGKEIKTQGRGPMGFMGGPPPAAAPVVQVARPRWRDEWPSARWPGRSRRSRRWAWRSRWPVRRPLEPVVLSHGQFRKPGSGRGQRSFA